MNGAELQRLAAVETEVKLMREEVGTMHKTLDDLRITTANRGGVFSAVLFALTIALGALGGYVGSLLSGGR